MPAKKAPSPVVVQPPVPLMQPRLVAVLLAESALPGGAVYEVKLDGVRACAARTEVGVELWSRSGGRLDDRFPEIVPALTAQLGPGVVLDGEMCAYRAPPVRGRTAARRSGAVRAHASLG